MAEDYFKTACNRHGYRDIPSSERVLLDALDLDRSGERCDALLELAARIEARENQQVK